MRRIFQHFGLTCVGCGDAVIEVPGSWFHCACCTVISLYWFALCRITFHVYHRVRGYHRIFLFVIIYSYFSNGIYIALYLTPTAYVNVRALTLVTLIMLDTISYITVHFVLKLNYNSKQITIRKKVNTCLERSLYLSRNGL